MKVRIVPLFVSLGVVIVLGVTAVFVNRFQVGKSASATLDLARESVEEEEFSRAVGFFSDYLSLRENDAEVRGEYGILLSKMGRLDEAFFELEAALRQNPELDLARESLVGTAMAMKRFTDARFHLKLLLESQAKSDELHWLLGNCEKRLGNRRDAADAFQDAVELKPSRIIYSTDLASLLTEEPFTDYAKAESVFANLVEVGEPQALAYVARGQWFLRRATRSLSPRGTSIQSLIDQAREDADAARILDASNPAVVNFLCELSLSADNTTDGLLQLIDQSLVDHPTAVALYQTKARVLARESRLDESAKALRVGLEKNPGSADLLWSLVQLQLDRGEEELAPELIAELEAVGIGEAQVCVLQAKVLISEEDFEGAIRLLEDCRPLFQTDPVILAKAEMALARCYGLTRRYNKQVAALRGALDAAPDDSLASSNMAEALLRVGRVREAIAEYWRLVNRPNAPASAIIKLARLVIIDNLQRPRSQREWEPMARLFDQLKQFPDSAEELCLLRCELLIATDRIEESLNVVRKYLDENPDKLRANLLAVSLLIKQGEIRQASGQLQTVLSAFGDKPQIRLLQADLFLQEEGESVKERLNQIARPMDDWSLDKRMLLAKGMTSRLIAAGLLQDAWSQIDWIIENGAQADLRRFLLLQLDICIELNRADRIKQWLKTVRENRAPEALWSVGEATRLLLLAKDDDQSQQQLEKALRLLSEAEISEPNWERLFRVRGEVYLELESRGLATENLVRAFQLGDNDLKLASKIVKLLYQQERFAEAENALVLLQERGLPLTPELRTLASRVFANLRDFNQAIEIAEANANQGEDPNEILWIAQLYGIAGRSEEALKVFQSAIERQPKSLAPRIALVQFLVRNGDADSAFDAIDAIRSELPPESVDAALARAFLAVENVAEAEMHFQQHLKKSPSDVKALAEMAQLQLDQGRQSEALPILKRLLELPEQLEPTEQSWARQQYASAFAAVGGADAYRDALRILDVDLQEFGDSIDNQRARAYVFGSRLDEPSIDRAIEILEGMVDKRSQFSLEDSFLLASLYEKKSNWAAYQSTMRRVLATGGADVERYVRAYTDSLIRRGY
ncbi:MAG: tetratricopeptide repeat protein, partial [Planctomycetota bacterium]